MRRATSALGLEDPSPLQRDARLPFFLRPQDVHNATSWQGHEPKQGVTAWTMEYAHHYPLVNLRYN